MNRAGVGFLLQLAVSVVLLAVLVRQVRVEIGEPSGMPLDRRARLAAIQAWGPWDGRTGKR